MKIIVVLFTLFLILPLSMKLISSNSAGKKINIANKRLHGVAIIEGKKYKVPYTVEQTMVTVKPSNFYESMFLGNIGSVDASFITLLVELIMSILIILLIIAPYAIKLKIFEFKLLQYSLLLFICSEAITGYVTKSFVENRVNGLASYYYNSNYDHISALFIPLITIWVLKKFKEGYDSDLQAT